MVGSKKYVSWGLVRDVIELTSGFPQDYRMEEATPIRFCGEEDFWRGMSVVYLLGSVIQTDDDEVVMVTRRALAILQKLKINFREDWGAVK